MLSKKKNPNKQTKTTCFPQEKRLLLFHNITRKLGPEENSSGKKGIHKKLHLKALMCQAWSHMPVTPASGEVKPQDHEFKVIFCYVDNLAETLSQNENQDKS